MSGCPEGWLVGWVERAPVIRVLNPSPGRHPSPAHSFAFPAPPPRGRSPPPPPPPPPQPSLAGVSKRTGVQILPEAQSHLPVGALGPSSQSSSPSLDHQHHLDLLGRKVLMNMVMQMIIGMKPIHQETQLIRHREACMTFALSCSCFFQMRVPHIQMVNTFLRQLP